MVFAVFDHDSLVSTMQHVWDQIAPPAMFTAAGNHAIRGSENFLDAVDMIKWNRKTTNAATKGTSAGYGYSGSTPITAAKQEGSNGGPATFDSESNFFVESWNKGQDVNVPPGFTPIRGENVLYADTLPPFDITMTFANEYGQCAFQKIYDVDILNEGSGVSVDSLVMERQMTYVARRLSPMIRGVYNREVGGALKGLLPTQ